MEQKKDSIQCVENKKQSFSTCNSHKYLHLGLCLHMLILKKCSLAVHELLNVCEGGGQTYGHSMFACLDALSLWYDESTGIQRRLQTRSH